MEPVTIGFIVYLLLVLFFGFYAARATKTIRDFALGGNRLGPWSGIVGFKRARWCR